MVSPTEARRRTVEVAALLEEFAAEVGPIPVQIRRNRFKHGRPGTPGRHARRGEVVEVGLHDFIVGYAAGEFELPIDNDDQVHPADRLTTTQVHDMSVEEVTAYLTAHPDQRDHVVALEQAGRGRREITHPAGDHDPDDEGESDGDEDEDDDEPAADQVVAGNADQVIAYAHAHPERAQELLEAEEAGKDRKGVRDALEALIG